MAEETIAGTGAVETFLADVALTIDGCSVIQFIGTESASD
jgi:hypothetical protein